MAPLPKTALESSIHSLENLAKRYLASAHVASPRGAVSTLSDSVKRSVLNSRAVSYVGELIRRQQQDCSIIPVCYGNINSGPAAGTVVGIILGSVGGFLLLLWLFYTCLNFGRLPASSSSTYTESNRVRSHRASSNRPKSSRSRRNSYQQETTSIRRGPSPSSPARPPPPMAPPPPMMQTPPPPPQQQRFRETVEERTERRSNRGTASQDESDEVVVIEEHDSTPPRRKSKSKRDSGESGYRTVDPGRYGGVVGGGRRDRR